MNSFTFNPTLNDKGAHERFMDLQRVSSLRNSLASKLRNSIDYKVQRVIGTQREWTPVSGR